MKRRHIKDFQVEQYKKADERIRWAAFNAQAIFINCAFPWPQRSFKRYQII
jgi:hypothetical protein